MNKKNEQYDELKVVSIIPAPPGWKSVFASEDKPYFSDIIALGIYEDTDGYRSVHTISHSAEGFLDPDDKNVNFIGVSSPNYTGDWNELNTERIKILNLKK